MSNKMIANVLSVSIVLAVITAIFEEAMSTTVAGGLYSIAGIGMVGFGVWASVRLHKSDTK